MRRALVLALGFSALATGPATAQGVRPRSADYLLATEVSDVRALWVNPAGLGVVPGASVLADVVFEAPDAGNLRIAQWGVGFSSRGISFGYQRDRLRDNPATPEPDAHSTDALRFGAAFPFRRGALGASFTWFRPNTSFQSSQRSGDVGLLYQVLPVAVVGAVLRNIGRPYVGNQIAPLTGTLGVAWRPVPRMVGLAAEASVAERTGASGYDLSYRAGGQFSLPVPFGVNAVAAIDLDEDLGISGWAFGVSIGTADRVLATASGAPGGTRIDRFGLTGISHRTFQAGAR